MINERAFAATQPIREANYRWDGIDDDELRKLLECYEAAKQPSEPAVVNSEICPNCLMDLSVKRACCPKQPSEPCASPVSDKTVCSSETGKDERQSEPVVVDDRCITIAENALLLAARWFKLNFDDETLAEHPPSKADLAGMFDAMQEAREKIKASIRARSPELSEERAVELMADFIYNCDTNSYNGLTRESCQHIAIELYQALQRIVYIRERV